MVVYGIQLQQFNISRLCYYFSPGNGGNAGNVNVRYRTLNGQVKLKSCRGAGAAPANNGQGGEGTEIFKLSLRKKGDANNGQASSKQNGARI